MLFVALKPRWCAHFSPLTMRGAGGVLRPETWGKSVFGCRARMRPPLTPPSQGGEAWRYKCGEICVARIAPFHRARLGGSEAENVGDSFFGWPARIRPPLAPPSQGGEVWRDQMRGTLRGANRAVSSAQGWGGSRPKTWGIHSSAGLRECDPPWPPLLKGSDFLGSIHLTLTEGVVDLKPV